MSLRAQIIVETTSEADTDTETERQSEKKAFAGVSSFTLLSIAELEVMPVCIFQQRGR